MNVDVWTEVDRLISEYKFDDAVHWLEEQIKKSEIREFQLLIGAEIANDRYSVLSEINEFLTYHQKQFDVKSIYSTFVKLRA